MSDTKYLSANIYTIKGTSGSSNGVTGGSVQSVLIPCDVGNITAEDAKILGDPIIEIETHPVDKYGTRSGKPNFIKTKGGLTPCIAQANPEGKSGGMFGGNYITCSDSRFPLAAPIAVFDRFE